MRLTETVRLELKRLVQEEDVCIDATAGNGYDTLTMTKLVGPKGKVFAVDIQKAAIESTKSKIEEAELGGRCAYFLGDHAEILSDFIADHTGRVRAITFNLGYLPGSDKTRITKPESTLKAIQSATQLLSRNSALFITAYRGHAGGLAEAEVVERALQKLPEDEWTVQKHEPALRDPQRVPPVLWIVRR